MKGYVYQFISNNGTVLYIGRTKDMKSRMTLHFTKGECGHAQIPESAVSFIKECVYTETESFADAIVLEAYMIAREKPAYNKEYVTDDELTLEIDISKYEWREWKLNLTDNPDHHIFVWKNQELLYEIPKIAEVYTPLKQKLGLTTEMNIPYAKRIKDGEYELMRLSSKRRIARGNERQIPKYQFMGYPKEIEEWQAAKQGQEQ